MNKENILKVADAIEQSLNNPATDIVFNMHYPLVKNIDECSSIGCVAGFAKFLFGSVGKGGSSILAGEIHLGVRSNKARELFYADSMNSHNKPGLTAVNEAAKLVPDALRWMVANEDINWNRAMTAVMMDNVLGKASS